MTYLNTQTWMAFTEVIVSFPLTLRTNLCHFAYSTNQKIIQIQSKNMITDQYACADTPKIIETKLDAKLWLTLWMALLWHCGGATPAASCTRDFEQLQRHLSVHF